MSSAFSASDLHDLAAILIDAAATEILPRFRRLGDGDVVTKSGPQDLVTVADRAAERRIALAVAERFPDALFVGEESCADDPRLLGRLAEARFAVVVDPIDGTFNFASGLPLFGVMAAVVVDGETVAGVVLDPICGDWAGAVKGEGARLVFPDGRPDRPLAVAAAPDDLAELHGPVSWSYLPEGRREAVCARMARLGTTYGYRCAAHEYRLLAGAGAHLALYGKLMPWDHLAGVLIHAEAGGHAAKLDGTPYRPNDTDGGLLLAPDAATWRRVHAALFED